MRKMIFLFLIVSLASFGITPISENKIIGTYVLEKGGLVQQNFLEFKKGGKVLSGKSGLWKIGLGKDRDSSHPFLKLILQTEASSLMLYTYGKGYLRVFEANNWEEGLALFRKETEAKLIANLGYLDKEGCIISDGNVELWDNYLSFPNKQIPPPIRLELKGASEYQGPFLYYRFYRWKSEDDIVKVYGDDNVIEEYQAEGRNLRNKTTGALFEKQ